MNQKTTLTVIFVHIALRCCCQSLSACGQKQIAYGFNFICVKYSFDAKSFQRRERTIIIKFSQSLPLRCCCVYDHDDENQLVVQDKNVVGIIQKEDGTGRHTSWL